jgi:hypothetical protein
MSGLGSMCFFSSDLLVSMVASGGKQPLIVKEDQKEKIPLLTTLHKWLFLLNLLVLR